MSEQGGHGSFLALENQPACPPTLSNSAGTGSEDNKSAGKDNKNQQQQQQPLQDSINMTNNKRGRGTEGGGGGGESDHEMHILTERERRKKMRNMFSNLHDLLPQLPPKADKSTIVDEAINYIKTLEKSLQKLQKQKLERLQGSIDFGYYNDQLPIVTTQNQEPFDSSSTREAFMADQVSSKNTDNFSNTLSISESPSQFQTWTSSNVVLNICGKGAQISVCSLKKQGLFTTVCCILEKYKLEVISAHVSSDSNRCMFMIQVRLHPSTGASNHPQLSEAFDVTEIFKQAAAEIMCWVTS